VAGPSRAGRAALRGAPGAAAPCTFGPALAAQTSTGNSGLRRPAFRRRGSVPASRAAEQLERWAIGGQRDHPRRVRWPAALAWLIARAGPGSWSFPAARSGSPDRPAAMSPPARLQGWPCMPVTTHPAAWHQGIPLQIARCLAVAVADVGGSPSGRDPGQCQGGGDDAWPESPVNLSSASRLTAGSPARSGRRVEVDVHQP